MAFPPVTEVLGVALATGVAALWVFAASQWALADLFEAPGKTARIWPFGLAAVATVGVVWGLRSSRPMKRETK